jgi:hypothetical protein
MIQKQSHPGLKPIEQASTKWGISADESPFWGGLWSYEGMLL